MDVVKQLLSSLKYQLEYLTLSSIDSDIDLADGNAWREYLSIFTQLRTFNFCFSFSFQRTLDVTNERIQSFKSNYWCIEKNWCVVAHTHSIFTVPHFSPHTVELLSSQYRPDYVWTNSPYQYVCNQNTKTIIFDGETFEKLQKEKQIYYRNVEHITWLNSSTMGDILHLMNYLSLMTTSFDLSRVTTFEGIPTKKLTIFMDFIGFLPCLKEIHFHYSPNFFKKLPLLSKIRRLRIWINKKDEKYFSKELDELCRVFFSIEHLHLMMHVENDIIFYLIQQFNHLRSLAILCKPNDKILRNLDHWNKEETLLSVSTIYSNVANRKLVAFWIDTSQRHLIEQVKYETLSKNTNQNKCILL